MAKATNPKETNPEEVKNPSCILEEKAESIFNTIETRPEMNTKLSFKERIMAFVESRGTEKFVRLDGFLRALYPPRINEKPGHLNQGNMIALKNDLRELQKGRRLVFANNSFEQLGKHYWETGDPERKTKYHNVTTLAIEVRLP